ncbi:hypothetical protein AB685_17675 [Bacillus sp. LL01]|uniref:hypothetical protein n=1 Tax=Bacillus sp. LL01 TaxID=1665556 RepID=UPI00064D33F5|nr:hypothetical protein [Bacillus sp. LL01]KMJ57232.1 hypothetical protein AB685_17675 [Bacillus sp. LL01]
MGTLELLMIAIIWGGLMLYFIIPSDEMQELPHQTMSLGEVLIISLNSVTFHFKTVLVLLFLLLTYLAIWYSLKDITWYNEAHGVPSTADPADKLPFYLAGVTIYAVLLYAAVVGKKIHSLMKTGD